MKHNKCIYHHEHNYEMLNLDKNSIRHLLCDECLREIDISKQDLISLEHLFDNTPKNIILMHPILNQLADTIVNNINQDLIIQKVNEFFSNVKQEVNIAIDKAERNAKVQLSKLVDIIWQLKQELQSLDVLQQIQEVIQNQRHDILHEFIQREWQTCEDRLKDIQTRYNSFNDIIKTFTLNQASMQLSDIIDEISYFNLFQGIDGQVSILDQIQFIPSLQYNCSAEYLVVDKLRNKQISIIQISDMNKFRQGYVNIPLTPNTKYSFILSLEQNDPDNEPLFSIGLVPHLSDLSALKHVSQYNLCYEETDNYGYGIDQLVKGGQLHSTVDCRSLRKKIEMRIHLREKMIQISDYPHYHNIIQLNSKCIIENHLSYYLHIAIAGHNNQVKILNAMRVEEFNGNM